MRLDHAVRGRVERPSQARLYRRTPLSVDFVSEDVGLMSTQGGLVLATDDGGLHWRVRASGQPLDQVSMVSPRLVYGARSGVLVRSDDGGRTWARAGRLPRHTSEQSGLTDLQFVDPLHGWRADTAVWSTADGGSTWRRRFRCTDEEWLGGISFLDARRGFAICGSQPATIEQGKQLWTTIDGGTTWRLRERTAWFGAKPIAPGGNIPSEGHVGTLSFRTDADGWLATGRVGIYGTRDGGHRWALRLFTEDFRAGDMPRPSAQRAYALLWQVGLVRSDDAGRHWRQLYPPSPGSPIGPVVPLSARVAIGAGTGGLLRSAGTIVATVDGGRTWSFRSSLPGVAVQQLVRGPRRRVWALTLRAPGLKARRIFRSDDNGRTWTRVPQSDVPRPVDPGVRLQGERLLQWRDGKWHPVATPPRIGLLGLETLDERHWWVEGHICGPPSPKGSAECRGSLVRTTDAGRHWELITLPRGFVFTDITFVSPTLGWEPGWSGGHWLTRDGGRSWRFVYPRWAS